jgi:hypothetical protein
MNARRLPSKLPCSRIPNTEQSLIGEPNQPWTAQHTFLTSMGSRDMHANGSALSQHACCPTKRFPHVRSCQPAAHALWLQQWCSLPKIDEYRAFGSGYERPAGSASAAVRTLFQVGPPAYIPVQCYYLPWGCSAGTL